MASKEENESAESLRKQGTRVFKKSSPNGKITAYLGKRDFVDHLTHVEPIDGVVLVDPDYLKDRKVFVQVVAAFRYGREDLDVLGLAFRKDLYLSVQQVYPPLPEHQRTPTRLQERLLKKLGENAYQFFFELPHSTPASVTLQPGPNDNGKPCGVDYELQTYVADSSEDKPHKRNSVRLAIRKLTYAPDSPAPQPTAEITKDFLMSAGPLRLEATLDKEKYYHGESIAVNVLVDNNSRKSVKKIKITVFQISDIMLFSRAMYKCVVDEIETEEGFPIPGNHTGWCKVYMLCPLLANNRDKRGLALDGKLKHEDTNLASSTIVPDGCQKESLGIIVHYKVKVRLYLSFGSGVVSVQLPFTLTHPKPIEEPNMADTDDIHLQADHEEDEATPTSTPPPSEGGGGLGPDLIHLETCPAEPGEVDASSVAMSEDDRIFEDFARYRLQNCSNSNQR